jgi:hypothetical protein
MPPKEGEIFIQSSDTQRTKASAQWQMNGIFYEHCENYAKHPIVNTPEDYKIFQPPIGGKIQELSKVQNKTKCIEFPIKTIPSKEDNYLKP